MSDTTLRDLVLARLEKDTQPEDEWSALVLAALEGPGELAELLEGEGAANKAKTPTADTPKHPQDQAPQIEQPPQKPRTAYLRKITAQGFRGIGPQATLDLTPGAGLTLVVGRNGSGKSSFAEGLELLLTGDTYRWSQRSKVWRDGWRNLHHPKAALAAEFAPPSRTGPEALGWETPLEAYPPSSRTTSSAPSSTRAPPSSTTPCPRSSASTPSWTPRPPSSRPEAPAKRHGRCQTCRCGPSGTERPDYASSSAASAFKSSSLTRGPNAFRKRTVVSTIQSRYSGHLSRRDKSASL